MSGLVRLALPAEATAITEVQRAVLREPSHPYHPLLAHLDPGEMTQVWRQAVLAPPLASYRVLVATSGPSQPVVGMVAVGPSSDPDAEAGDGQVLELLVHPAARRQGHGSRLVQAAVETLRLDGFTRATWWLASTDDALRRFLTAMGWAPDGVHGEIDNDYLRLKQVRLHTDISEVSGPAG
ncbi:MAG: GNAT family N-acetyltransferase [Actinomycetia bacterium]|nr:GNAT family N-acetyltransferase [Actinomycetes bacterium]